MKRKRTRQAKRIASLPTPDTGAWLASNPDHLISCPRQPGGLKLSRAACAKRYLAANEPRWSNIGAEPFPIFVIKMNLIACRECKTGEKMAKELAERAA